MANKQRPVIMTTTDKVKVIAVYDGWELRGEPEFIPPYKIWIKQLPSGTKLIPYISPSGKEYDDWAKEMKYATSMDWLHPVAMKVLDGLFVRDLIYNENAQWSRATIRQYCATKPINGEYIDLFNAVYEGIGFLNQNKPTA